MVYRPGWYRKQNYYQIPILYWYQKCEILIIDTQMAFKKDIISPTLVQTTSTTLNIVFRGGSHGIPTLNNQDPTSNDSQLCLNGFLRLKSRDTASMLGLAYMSGTWNLGPHVNRP